MFAVTTHSRPEISFDQMRNFMEHGWGDLGLRVADCWHNFNTRFFGGALRPVPILLVATSPHGHWLGLTHGSHERAVHRIELTNPGRKRVLVARRATLLHEMIHQHLVERGEDPHHDGEPWRREITRMHAELIEGERLWCAYDQVKKINGSSVRVPRPAPEPGMRAIAQKDIARWPRSVGIDLGKL